MTLDEAQRVGGILMEADGGCSHCARNLFELAQKAFPEFRWHMREYGESTDAPEYTVTEA